MNSTSKNLALILGLASLVGMPQASAGDMFQADEVTPDHWTAVASRKDRKAKKAAEKKANKSECTKPGCTDCDSEKAAESECTNESCTKPGCTGCDSEKAAESECTKESCTKPGCTGCEPGEKGVETACGEGMKTSGSDAKSTEKGAEHACGEGKCG